MSAGHGRGYVLSRCERAEADLDLAVLLDDGSVRRVVARAALRSVRRFSGGLSPFTLYRFVFGRGRGPRALVQEAVVERAHPGLLAQLRRSIAAGAVSQIALAAASDVTGSIELFERYCVALTAIELASGAAVALELVRFGMDALALAGHGVELGRCVRCERVAPERAAVQVDARAGGVVCRACGGGRIELRAAQRRLLSRQNGETGAGAAIDARGIPMGMEAELMHAVAAMMDEHAPRAAKAVRGALGHWR